MLELLAEGGNVTVSHRDEALHLDGLVCHRTASFPTGIVRLANDDEVLGCFAPFITGFTMQDASVDEIIRVNWHKQCPALGHHEKAGLDHLLFSSPNIMAVFTHIRITEKTLRRKDQVEN